MVLVLLVQLGAVAAVASGAIGMRVSDDDIRLTALLALLGVLHTEIAAGVERIRRRVTGASYFDLTSVWTFAAAVLLPPTLAAAAIAVIYTHLQLRVWRATRIPPFRHVFTAATVILAAFAAHQVLTLVGGGQGWPDDLAGLGSIALAIAAYIAVNTMLVGMAIALSSGSVKVADIVGDWDDNALEVATLSLGALTAIVLTTNAWLVALVLPPLLVLHRAVLVRQLEEAAGTDGKTGLLTAAEWHHRADREIRRAQRTRSVTGVLILDLDHFKAVNDGYGHLAGDEVLAAVARALQTEIRENDVAGRFGGEEFVVLLPDLVGGEEACSAMRTVAERIRLRVSELAVPVETPDGPLTITGLTTSVGGAGHPADGTSLQQVMSVADAALYTAKRAGRNLVRIAAPPPVAAPGAAPS